MGEDLRGAVSGWLAVEQSADEGRADAALTAVFQALPATAVPASLAGRVLRGTRTVQLSAGRMRLRPGWKRPAQVAGVAAGGAALIYLIVRTLLPLLVTLFVKLVSGLLDGVLWMSVGLSAGLDVWTMLARAGRLIGAAVTTPRVAVALVVIEAVGAGALYLIQRILTSEKESSRS
jgi:hypothetical protein